MIITYNNRKAIVKHTKDGEVIITSPNKVVTNVDMRLRSALNPIRFLYGDYIMHDAEANDPKGEKWNKICEWVKSHEDDVFDEYGDFKAECYLQEFKKRIIKEIAKSEI